MLVKEITEQLRAEKSRSAWENGVRIYAIELLEDLPIYYDLHLQNNETKWKSNLDLKSLLLNGAENWTRYSYGACSLVYDGDICGRLLPPSQQKRFRFGEREPGNGLLWLDLQARALAQAYYKIRRIIRTHETRKQIAS